jgi:hypothetical protein
MKWLALALALLAGPAAAVPGAWTVPGDPLTATVSPLSAFCSTGTSGHSCSTGAVTTTPQGGAGGYTHAWSLVSGSSTDTTATSPTGASTAWAYSGGICPNVDGTWQDLVTDAAGSTVTVQVSVLITSGC